MVNNSIPKIEQHAPHQRIKVNSVAPEMKQKWYPSCFYCYKSSAKCHEWENDGIAITTNGAFRWSFVTQTFRNG